MILIPFDMDAQQESGIVVIIERDNLDRMMQADPITLQTATDARAGFLKPIKYPQKFSVMIAYEEDSGLLYQLAQAGDVRALIQHIQRGYQFKDNDGRRGYFNFTREQ
jgi:hypothetical protein